MKMQVVVAIVATFISAPAVAMNPDPQDQPAQGESTQAATAESSEWSDDRPIGNFGPNFVRDVRNLVTPLAAATAVMGGTATLAAHAADVRVKHWVDQSGPPFYTQLGNELGSVWIESAAALATYGLGQWKHRPALAHIGSDLIRGQVLNSAIVVGIKLPVDRTRPNGERFSLPSFHSGATFASAAVLEGHFGWKVGVPAYATAAFVGWTRVRDSAHWMSDVVLGATIGTITGQAITRSHRSSQWQVAPTAARGRIGVVVARVS